MLVESFSGIRGIYGESLTDEVAEKYAYSYISFIKKNFSKPVIVIGADSRPSSELIKQAIIRISDIDIIDVDVASTPAVEFAVRHFKADGGIIITASHNEPYWNGFKFLNPDGSILSPKDMGGIIDTYGKLKNKTIEEYLKELSHDNKKGVSKTVFERHEELVKKYSDFLLKFIKKDIKKIKEAKLKVVIDPNGGTGIIAKEILEKAGVEVTGINMDYGIFSRAVEPTLDSILYLGNIAREKGAEFGAGFDCDADRLQIILPNNKLVSGHYLLGLIANEILKESKEKVIITNDATSGIVREVSEKNNSKLIEVEVGETNVVLEMQKNNAEIGGEGSSGGVIISPSKCRDGILTLLIILKIIAQKKAKLEKIIDDYPKYYTLSDKVKFNSKKHDSIKTSLEKYYVSKGFKIKKTGDISGGLKVVIDKKSFVWFRASKTEGNVMRIIADSDNEAKTEKLLKEAKGLLNRVK